MALIISPFWQIRKLREVLPPIKPLLGGDIEGINDLWLFVGADSVQGLKVSDELRALARNQLITLMVAEGISEAKSQDGRLWLKLKRCWLEVAVLSGLLMIIALGLRAGGYLAFLPPPLGLSETVAIAARNLEPGRLIQAGDFYTARLPRGINYFVVANASPVGLILKQGSSLSRFKPIHFDDVLRLQVVAKRDIIENTKITEEDLMLAWTAYQADALTKKEQVLNQYPLHSIPGGTVLSLNSLRAPLPSVQPPLLR
jgi:hypothetical protein